MTRLKPPIKGIITALIMIGISLSIYYSGGTNSNLGYLIYVAFFGGIIWTLWEHAMYQPEERTFGKLFSQGFKCFIVVTLIMVAFTAIIHILNPQWITEAAEAYREDLIKENTKTPAEIDKIVKMAKDNYVTIRVGSSIFGYLIIGSVFTVLSSLFLIRRK